ncbi:MAG: protein translocase subunit SecD [Clostridia bacterium]|nr:protein translocase subunit SecD [Clostridia bacterium]
MKKSISKIILVLVCIVFVASVALLGYKPMNITGIVDGGIKRGLDLVGGTSIVYGIKGDSAENATTYSDEEIEEVVSMLRNRVDRRGYTEAVVARYSNNMILVEIPDIDDPEKAVQAIGSTAKLSFVDSNNKEVLTGDDVVRADAVFGDYDGNGVSEWFISLEFNSDARDAFANTTEEMSKLSAEGKNYIQIKLDADLISQPLVNEKIDSTECVINGTFTKEDAEEIAALISAGRLPFELEVEELRAVGPTLGDNALETSLIAGAIGIILVMLFMIIIYRIPGLVSSISLIAYVALVSLVLVMGGVNLTLPGIAGIILTIGMAVDANVVIYERIKEELALGKSIKAGAKSGFGRAIWAVIDSNITTLIAAAVLIWKGTGTVMGFGITLGIGVIVSMFTAVLLSRFLLNAFIDMGISNPALLGAKKRKAIKNEIGGGDR